MGMNKVSVLKILSFLFFLNSISFFLYFSSSSNSDHHNHFIRSSHSQPRTNFPTKHWPILHSYPPWSQNPNVPTFRSCEAYFGNGFTRKIDLHRPQNGEKGGWFRCFYSETLRSSVCEGGRIRMDSGKVRVSKGGERLEEVSGRGEEDELPVFEPGAFELDGGNAVTDKLVGKYVLDEYVPQGEISMHTMRCLIDSIRVVKGHHFQCELGKM